MASTTSGSHTTAAPAQADSTTRPTRARKPTLNGGGAGDAGDTSSGLSSLADDDDEDYDAAGHVSNESEPEADDDGEWQLPQSTKSRPANKVNGPKKQQSGSRRIGRATAQQPPTDSPDRGLKLNLRTRPARAAAYEDGLTESSPAHENGRIRYDSSASPSNWAPSSDGGSDFGEASRPQVNLPQVTLPSTSADHTQYFDQLPPSPRRDLISPFPSTFVPPPTPLLQQLYSRVSDVLQYARIEATRDESLQTASHAAIDSGIAALSTYSQQMALCLIMNRYAAFCTCPQVDIPVFPITPIKFALFLCRTLDTPLGRAMRHHFPHPPPVPPTLDRQAALSAFSTVTDLDSQAKATGSVLALPIANGLDRAVALLGPGEGDRVSAELVKCWIDAMGYAQTVTRQIWARVLQPPPGRVRQGESQTVEAEGLKAISSYAAVMEIWNAVESVRTMLPVPASMMVHSGSRAGAAPVDEVTGDEPARKRARTQSGGNSQTKRWVKGGKEVAAPSAGARQNVDMEMLLETPVQEGVVQPLPLPPQQAPRSQPAIDSISENDAVQDHAAAAAAAPTAVVVDTDSALASTRSFSPAVAQANEDASDSAPPPGAAVSSPPPSTTLVTTEKSDPPPTISAPAQTPAATAAQVSSEGPLTCKTADTPARSRSRSCSQSRPTTGTASNIASPAPSNASGSRSRTMPHRRTRLSSQCLEWVRPRRPQLQPLPFAFPATLTQVQLPAPSSSSSTSPISSRASSAAPTPLPFQFPSSDASIKGKKASKSKSRSKRRAVDRQLQAQLFTRDALAVMFEEADKALLELRMGVVWSSRTRSAARSRRGSTVSIISGSASASGGGDGDDDVDGELMSLEQNVRHWAEKGEAPFKEQKEGVEVVLPSPKSKSRRKLNPQPPPQARAQASRKDKSRATTEPKSTRPTASEGALSTNYDARSKRADSSTDADGDMDDDAAQVVVETPVEMTDAATSSKDKEPSVDAAIQVDEEADGVGAAAAGVEVGQEKGPAQAPSQQLEQERVASPNGQGTRVDVPTEQDVQISSSATPGTNGNAAASHSPIDMSRPTHMAPISQLATEQMRPPELITRRPPVQTDDLDELPRHSSSAAPHSAGTRRQPSPWSSNVLPTVEPAPRQRRSLASSSAGSRKAQDSASHPMMPHPSFMGGQTLGGNMTTASKPRKSSGYGTRASPAPQPAVQYRSVPELYSRSSVNVDYASLIAPPPPPPPLPPFTSYPTPETPHWLSSHSRYSSPALPGRPLSSNDLNFSRSADLFSGLEQYTSPYQQQQQRPSPYQQQTMPQPLYDPYTGQRLSSGGASTGGGGGGGVGLGISGYDPFAASTSTGLANSLSGFDKGLEGVYGEQQRQQEW